MVLTSQLTLPYSRNKLAVIMNFNQLKFFFKLFHFLDLVLKHSKFATDENNEFKTN